MSAACTVRSLLDLHIPHASGKRHGLSIRTVLDISSITVSDVAPKIPTTATMLRCRAMPHRLRLHTTTRAPPRHRFYMAERGCIIQTRLFTLSNSYINSRGEGGRGQDLPALPHLAPPLPAAATTLPPQLPAQPPQAIHTFTCPHHGRCAATGAWSWIYTHTHT